MNHFTYINGELCCEQVPIRVIAEREGTPLYVYSYQTLADHYRVFDAAFADIDHLICFAAKANSCLAVLKALALLGSGTDIVSGGELYRSLLAGVDPRRIVYSGVGKTDWEIAYALETGILMFNVESEEELNELDRRAGDLGARAPVAIRVNPDIDPRVHPHVATGLQQSKFGLDIEKALEQYRRARQLANVDIVGVDCHIGSQVIELGPFEQALKKLSSLVSELKADGFEIGYVDVGGGLGITYGEESPPHPKEYGQAIIDEARCMDCTLVLEPGRVIVGNAGVLVTKVLYRKLTQRRNFIVVDAGMNDLIRPSLYGSFHGIRPVVEGDRNEIVADVVGPICESGDFLARDRKLPLLERGELIAVMSAGAYGFTMASHYNSRPYAAEIMVRGDRYHVARRREDYEDLILGESIPDFLN